MGFEDLCNTGLSLGLNNLNKPDHQYLFQSHDHDHDQRHMKNKKTPPKFDHYSFEFPSLTLGISSADQTTNQDPLNIQFFSESNGDQSTVLYRHQGSSMSTGVVLSSYSNSSVKKEREISEEEEVVERDQKINSKMSDEDEEHSARKKLRLTKEQSVTLEDTFKEHSTLNPKQKQALAKHLNLRPRQVEVWFQNRRARTKLKQTEVDYELLKKCCETLKDENRRLHKELQDLKATKLTAPFCMKLPASTLSMCPSCERISSSSGGDQDSSQNQFPIGSKPQFYNPFTYPSAAC